MLGRPDTMEHETCYETDFLYEDCDYFHSIIVEKTVEKVVNNEVDKSGIGNLILNMALPVTTAASMDETSKRVLSEKKYVTMFGLPFSKVTVVLVGSSGEGMNLPRMIHMKGDEYRITFPDEDQKFIFDALVVCPNRNRAFASPERAPNSSPVFLQLRFNPSFPRNRTPSLQVSTAKLGQWNPKDVVDDGLVNRKKLLRHARYALKDFVHSKEYEHDERQFKCMKGEPVIIFSVHGPAMSVEVEDKSTKTSHFADYVISLPCPKWPDEAKDWITRPRIWPDKSVVRKVFRKGCHIVPKPSKKEAARTNEFMYSFSVCDKIVTRQLSMRQKRCYLLLKYVFNYCINKADRGLCSYMCKTTFLWLCERRPIDEWTEYNPLECLVALLDSLKTYLKSTFLPHYYIPDHNLLDQVNNLCLEACVNDIDKVLDDPAEVVLHLTDNHRFSWLSRDVVLSSLLYPLVRSDNVTKKMLSHCVLSFMSTMLDKAEIQLVIPIICQQWIGDYIYPDTKDVIVAIEEVIHSNEDHPDIVNFKALTANLYHHMANAKLKEAGCNKEFLAKSLSIFQEIIGNAGDHIWIFGAYYDLLHQCEENASIIRHFASCVQPHNILETSGVYNVITAYNYLSALPNDFEHLSYIDAYIPSPAYILFKVTLAYAALATQARSQDQKYALRKEANKSITYLKQWCNRKQNMYPSMSDDVLNYVLSIAALAVGNLKLVDDAIKAVLSIGSSIYTDLQRIPVMTKEKRGCGTRYQPYRKLPTSTYHVVNETFKFPGSRVHVGRFIHN